MKRSNRTYYIELVCSLFFILLTACQQDGEEDALLVKAGDTAPAFSLSDADGTVLESFSLKGKVYILTFFDTLCPDCQKELPVLQQLYNNFEEKIIMLNVPRNQTKDIVQKYWDEAGFSMPFYMPKDPQLYYKFAQRGVPRVFIVDAAGKVEATYSDSPIADYTTLENILLQLTNF